MDRRRAISLILAAPFAAGCAGDFDPEEESDMRQGLPPWHLWSITQQFNITLTTPNFTQPTFQLSKVSYKRPTTWCFLTWLNVQHVTTAGGNDTVTAFFDLIVGTGRGQVTIASWVQLSQAVANNGNTFLWSNVAPVVGLQGFGGGATPQVPFSDKVVAEDIQCSARLFFGGNVNDTLQAEVGAAFAPMMHVRPDWFLKDFRGGETGGR